jgi:hypothetical protein
MLGMTVTERADPDDDSANAGCVVLAGDTNHLAQERAYQGGFMHAAVLVA